MQTIHGYPSALVIYKSNASRFYWVRYYFQSKYHIKTTKSENVKDAKAFAIKFYTDLLINAVRTNTNEHSKAFSVVATAFFETAKANTNPEVFKGDTNRYKQHLLPFFKEQNIDTISNAQLSQLIVRLASTGISPATIKHHFIVLRKIFKYAIANDLMKTLPVFPKVTGQMKTAQKRDYLTQDEYELVVKCAEKLAQKNEVVRGISITPEMKFLIQFMVNSFIRPSDLRTLKHQHVKKMHDASGTEWLALSHPATKTTAHQVQAMPASVHIYERLMQYRKDAKLKTSLDDYVFFPQYKNRTTAMGVISRLFNRIIDESLIERTADKNITLYSLRHTAIMLRLIIGNVNTLALARNARTSQAMIDKFYAAHLTTEQVRKQLHAFPEKTKTSAKSKTKSKKSATKDPESSP